MRILVACLFLAACGNGDVNSNADAKKAYLSLDPSIDQAISLGFDGFNSASSANISPQTANGTKSGTLTVTGHVDQGTSANKTMNLNTAYMDFSDDGSITFNTDATALPALSMNLMSIPSAPSTTGGTVNGTFAGNLTMTGDLKGSLMMNLSFTGDLMTDASGKVLRVPGSTHITGTAVSSNGTFNVDVTK